MFLPLHVGAGRQIAGLTVFPVWGEETAEDFFRTYAEDLEFSEVRGGPSGQQMVAFNPTQHDAFIIAGELVPGDELERLIFRSAVIPAGQEATVSTAYAGMERWGFDYLHVGERMTDRVFTELARYDRRSSDGLLRDAVEAVEHVRAYRPFPGQVGVLVGVGDHPLVGEIFDRPEALARRFTSILAASLVAVSEGAPNRATTVTPDRNARAFMGLTRGVELRSDGTYDSTESWREYVGDCISISALTWKGRIPHAVIMNPRHYLNAIR